METTKKYELSNITIEINGVTLHRIKALKDFSDVKSGYLGGWVEKEDNLSQIGNAWVYDDAKVYGNAKVFGNAKVYGNAKVFGNAEVYGNALVCDNARVYGNSEVYGDAKVYGYAWVYDKSSVHGNARIRDYAEVYNNAEVYGNAWVFGNAKIHGVSKVCGNANIHGIAEISDGAMCSDYAELCGDAVVKNNADYIIFKNFWSSGRYFTWTRSNNMWKVGCFYGTGEELIKKAYNDSEKSGRGYERVVMYVESILEDEKNEKE